MSIATGTMSPHRHVGDELASSVIHGIGIVLSVAGLAVLVAFAALHGNALTRAFVRFVAGIAPKPDVAYMLDADPYLARERKPEYPLDFLIDSRKRYHKLAVLLYVGMGWIGMIAFRPLSDYLQGGGMALLIGGGVAYTLGVPFYLWRRLPYHHALWHVFVLAGSVLHFLAVLLYVIPHAAT